MKTVDASTVDELANTITEFEENLGKVMQQPITANSYKESTSVPSCEKNVWKSTTSMYLYTHFNMIFMA